MVHDFLVNNDLSSVCAFWGVRCFLVLKSGCFFGYHMDIFSVAKQTNSSLWCETPPRSSGKWRLMGIPCFKHIYTIYIYNSVVTVIGRRIIPNASSVPSLLVFQPHPWFYSTPLTDSFAMFCQSLQEKTFSVTCDQRGWIMNVIVHSMAIPTHVWRRTLQREMIQRGQRSHMCWSLAWVILC